MRPRRPTAGSAASAEIRAAYLIDRETWYLKPLVDLNLTHINLNGFSEGAGGANLIVPAPARPSSAHRPRSRSAPRPACKAAPCCGRSPGSGLSAFSNTDFAVSAAFGGAPAGVAPFRVTTGIDPVTADVAAGADLFLPGTPWAFKLAYSGRYGARVRDQGFRLKASIRF